MENKITNLLQLKEFFEKHHQYASNQQFSDKEHSNYWKGVSGAYMNAINAVSELIEQEREL